MGIHRKYVNKKTHGSFFIVTNCELWAYIENMCLIIHIVLYKRLKLSKKVSW